MEIPEGVREIKSQWFMNSNIETVLIAASVEEIGSYAFCECHNLRNVTFAAKSRLEKLGQGCFMKS